MKSLTIKNFKCFEEQTIKFSNLTVLAGGNGAGKSTVIQSFLLFAQSFKRKDFKNIPKMLYINDYYCELGSSNRLLNYSANEETIEFVFNDKNDKEVEFITSKDKEDLNILNIDNILEVIKSIDASDALNFVAFFDFIGADRFGPKPFHHTDSNFSRINVGRFGEYTALILHNHKLKSLDNMTGDLLYNVNLWLSKIFGFIQVDTQFIDEANIAMIKVKNHPKGEYESPVNMPYGVSYLLPIIVSCLVRNIPKSKLFEDYKSSVEENEMVVIENPEAHLHPSAQSMLGVFLAMMSNYMQIVIETHSEHIINGIRLATIEDVVDHNNISINFFEANVDSLEPNVTNIKIDVISDLTDWPRGFFDQQTLDIGTIFRKRAEKHAFK